LPEIGIIKFLNAQIVPASFTWEMANVEARMNLFHLVSQAAAFGVPGDAVEAGAAFPHIYERLSPGAIVMFGVYYDEKILRRDDTPGTFKLPGVMRATDEFFRDKPESVSVLYANEYSIGYFRKPAFE
jgi:hypothetical protein